MSVFDNSDKSFFAYSSKVILGGQNIGINIQNNGVIVIGFYKLNGYFNKGTTEIKVGDLITKVNGIKISSIKELTQEIENNIKDNKVTLTLIRDKKEFGYNISEGGDGADIGSKNQQAKLTEEEREKEAKTKREAELKERENSKLRNQHMPKRYWNHLTEI